MNNLIVFDGANCYDFFHRSYDRYDDEVAEDLNLMTKKTTKQIKDQTLSKMTLCQKSPL